jgi:hypothetical protein
VAERRRLWERLQGNFLVADESIHENSLHQTAEDASVSPLRVPAGLLLDVFLGGHRNSSYATYVPGVRRFRSDCRNG